MENSKIEWTDHTFNPWIGCQKVSEGCKFCYAENLMDTRWNKVQWGPQGERKRTSDSNWRQPFVWNRAAKESGQRARVFCASLADVFEDNPQVDPWRSMLWEMIELTTHLDWLLLTKRPQNINRMVSPWWQYPGPWPANVWVGTSVEDQAAADQRIPELLQVPAAVRFLSCEPLLGPVDLRNLDIPLPARTDWLTGGWAVSQNRDGHYRQEPRIHWVIVGGESGPSARPMQQVWAEALSDQCQAAGTAFLMKQMGSAWAKANGLSGKADDLTQIPVDLRVREFPGMDHQQGRCSRDTQGRLSTSRL